MKKASNIAGAEFQFEVNEDWRTMSHPAIFRVDQLCVMVVVPLGY